MNRAWIPLFLVTAAIACSERPNVIVVMTDDQRWDTIEHMPYLSVLAEQSVVFENAVVTSPLCCPSRASFLTGLPMSRHGVLTNRPPLGGAPAFDPDNAMPVVLQGLGYRTALFGKYMNAVDALEEQPPPGWNVWHAFVQDGFNYHDYLVSEDGQHVVRQQYSTDWMVDRAVEFIERSDGPFFLLLAPFAPHFNEISDVTPAERHDGAFSEYIPPERPAFAEEDLSGKPSFLSADSAELIDFLEPALLSYERDTLESLLAVDEAVEKLIDALRARGIENSTLVVYTSDNGMLYGEHRFVGKNVPYEEAIRVPLIAWCPTLCPPRRVATLVTNLDLAETIMKVAGHDRRFGEGSSLVPFLEGATEEEISRRSTRRGRHRSNRRGYFRENPAGPSAFGDRTIVLEGWPIQSLRFSLFSRAVVVPGWTAWRSKDWKYIVWYDGFVEFYDLVADPSEIVNLLGPLPGAP